MTKIKTCAASARAGFTLLELLLVIAIMGLIAAIAIPQFSTPESLSVRSGAAREIAASLREARRRAIFENRTVSFLLDVEEKSYRVAEGPAKTLPAAVQVTMFTAQSALIDAERAVITFFSDGSSTGGYVELPADPEAGAAALRVRVNYLTGRIDVQQINP